MRFLIIITPKDFRDESVSLIKLFFDKWGIQYSISSYTSNRCTGIHGAVYTPDIHASKISPSEYDGIVLIDGTGIESYKLYDYRPLLDLMIGFNNSRKYIMSVNNAAKIPARANIIKNKRVSFSTDDRETLRLVNLFHGIPSDNEYEISGNLITIRKSSDIEESMLKILESMGVT
ncbi:MAG: DJ-1/PfpI family protein [Candidatus Micrarchaeota archaeon]|nr:DJ-1/PfpI family protein [Candidatus Micrarchaeota archaeon]